MKISEKIKLPLIIIGLVLVLVIVMQVRTCVKENKAAITSELEGKLEALKEEDKKEMEELKQEKKKVEEKVETLKVAVSELTERNQEYREELGKKDGELKELKNQFSLIDEEDKDGQILNLKAQIGNLEIQVNKTLKGWANADAKAVGWEKAFNLKDTYCKKLEKQLGVKDNLLRIADDLNINKDKKIARLKVGKTLERIVTVPLAVFGGFKLGQAIFGR